jgi:hypothetical protein
MINEYLQPLFLSTMPRRSSSPDSFRTILTPMTERSRGRDGYDSHDDRRLRRDEDKGYESHGSVASASVA